MANFGGAFSKAAFGFDMQRLLWFRMEGELSESSWPRCVDLSPTGWSRIQRLNGGIPINWVGPRAN